MNKLHLIMWLHVLFRQSSVVTELHYKGFLYLTSNDLWRQSFVSWFFRLCWLMCLHFETSSDFLLSMFLPRYNAISSFSVRSWFCTSRTVQYFHFIDRPFILYSGSTFALRPWLVICTSAPRPAWDHSPKSTAPERETVPPPATLWDLLNLSPEECCRLVDGFGLYDYYITW